MWHAYIVANPGAEAAFFAPQSSTQVPLRRSVSRYAINSVPAVLPTKLPPPPPPPSTNSLALSNNNVSNDNMTQDHITHLPESLSSLRNEHSTNNNSDEDEDNRPAPPGVNISGSAYHQLGHIKPEFFEIANAPVFNMPSRPRRSNTRSYYHPRLSASSRLAKQRRASIAAYSQPADSILPRYTDTPGRTEKLTALEEGFKKFSLVQPDSDDERDDEAHNGTGLSSAGMNIDSNEHVSQSTTGMSHLTISLLEL